MREPKIDPKLAKALVSGEVQVVDENPHFGIELNIIEKDMYKDDWSNREKDTYNFVEGCINGLAIAKNTEILYETSFNKKIIMGLKNDEIEQEEFDAIKRLLTRDYHYDEDLIKYIQIYHKVVPVITVVPQKVFPKKGND